MARGAGPAIKKKSAGTKDCPASDITVFAEDNWNGKSETFEVSNTTFKTNFDISFKDPVKSIIIKGNPWILYPEPAYAGRPTVLEEGKYKCLEDFKIEDIGSIKKIDDDLANPILMTFESSKFLGLGSGESSEAPWSKLGDRTMRLVAVGGAGVWGLAKDNSLWFRGVAGKTEATVGDTWTKMQSAPLKLISVGPNCVWCLDMDNHCVVRTDVSPQCPGGKNWTNVDGDYKSISVSSNGHVWAVDTTDRIWWRKGAKTQSATGSGWKCIAGSLTKIATGPCGVWGLDIKNQVFFRDGTADDPDDQEGSGWSIVDGKFIGLAVGDGVVWGLGANREFFYRSGIDKNIGTHWLRVEQPKDGKIVFKQVEVEGDTVVATDKDNNVFYKLKFSNDVKAGTATTVYDDTPHFDLSNLPSRASSYHVDSGGWVIYAEPNYQGKSMIHFGGECISNDPVVSGEAEYKPWSGQFGSARPLRGLNYRTLLCKVEPEWQKATLRFEREHVASFDQLNDTYDTCPAPWQPTLAVNTSVSHQFTLQQAQNLSGVTVVGTLFFIPPKDPISWEVKGVGPEVTSGKEFHRQLENPFYFETDIEASKASETKTIALLPRTVQGKTKTQAIVNIYKCTAKVPCKTSFRNGFLPNFDRGTEEWNDRADLISVDRTNVKVEIQHTNQNMARKFSNMPSNGSKSL